MASDLYDFTIYRDNSNKEYCSECPRAKYCPEDREEKCLTREKIKEYKDKQKITPFGAFSCFIYILGRILQALLIAACIITFSYIAGLFASLANFTLQLTTLKDLNVGITGFLVLGGASLIFFLVILIIENLPTIARKLDSSYDYGKFILRSKK